MEYGGPHRRREYDEKDEDREYEERQRELSERVRKFEERYGNSEESESTESESEEKDEDREHEERQREISDRVRKFEEKYRSREEEENTESKPDEGQGVQNDLEGSGEEEKQENAEEHEKREETHEHDDTREINALEDCDVAKEDSESCRTHYETVEVPENQETHERNEDTEDQQEPEMEKEAPTEVSTGEHERDGEGERSSEDSDDEERIARPEDRECEHEQSEREDTEPEDKDEYDDLEKWVIKKMEEKGIDPDELRERWRERFVEDVGDELGEKEQKDSEVKEEEEGKRAASGEAATEEGYSTYEDGSGQVYAVKTEGSEHAETETVVENEQQEAPTEKTRLESSEQKEHAGASEENEHPQSETNTHSSRESTEHTSDSEQQAEQPERPREKERPRSRTREDVPEASSEQKNRLEESGAQKEHVETKPEEREKQQEKQEQEERLWPSLFPETREDRIRRMIREWHEEIDRVWESLNEEEKEPFREKIRRRLQDEEDFEELVTRHGQEHLRDDEEAREEIERYLSLRERLQEELDDGEAQEEVIDELAEELHIDIESAREWAHYQSVPEELRDLMARETQYRWREYLREFREIGLPQEVEELREAFDDMIFSDELEELSKWFQIRAMREQDQIDTYVMDGEECFSSSQIRKLSIELEMSEQKITEWLRGIVPSRVLEFPERVSEKDAMGVEGETYRERERPSLERWLRKPESMDEVETLLARHPHLRERKGFPKMYSDVKAYFQMKSILQEESNISDSELARRVGKARTTIRKWKLEKTQPDLFTRLAKNERMRQRAEKLLSDEAFRNYIDPTIVYEAFSSQRLKKKLQLDTIVDALWKLAKQVGNHTISFGLIHPYNSEHGPQWLSAVAEFIAENKQEVQNKLNAEYGGRNNTEYRISIMGDYLYIWNNKNDALDYLDLMKKELFFFGLKDRKQITREAINSLGLKGYYNLSKLILDMTEYPQVNRSNQTRIISDFRPESKYIMGMALRLILDSSHRTIKAIEPQIKKIGNGRQIVDPIIPSEEDSNHVNRFLKQHKKSDNTSTAYITNAIIDLIQNQTANVFFIEFADFVYQYNIDWSSTFQEMIESKRSEIQDELNHLFDGSVEIAIVEEILNIWKKDKKTTGFPDVLQDELFYFSAEYQKSLIEMTRAKLNHIGLSDLSELVRQITGYSQKAKSGKPRIVSGFQESSRYLPGRVLRFFLDVLQNSYSQIQPKVKKIGRERQILSPTVLETEEFYVLMARLFAIINSDGSLDETFRIHYYEKSSTRRERVKALLKTLGDVQTHDTRDRDGSIGGFRLPNVIGRVLARLGMTVGDKITQGTRLPDFIKYGSPKIQRAYLEELIPEDGWVTIDGDGYARIGWSRGIALSDPEKESRYGALNLVTEKHIELVIGYGDRRVRTYGGKSEDVFWILKVSKLNELMNSNDPVIASIANELDWIARTNGPQLLFDEQDLCEANGMKTKTAIPSNISYSFQTARLSVKWQTATSGQEDVAMWGLQAPPNDVTKKKLMKWMKDHSNLVDNAKAILQSMENEINRIISEFLLEKEKGDEGETSPS